MKYRITIETIEEKEVDERNYEIIGEDENGKKEYGNVSVPQIRNVETDIYTQQSDKDIDIKKVIDAFNQ